MLISERHGQELVELDERRISLGGGEVHAHVRRVAVASAVADLHSRLAQLLDPTVGEDVARVVEPAMSIGLSCRMTTSAKSSNRSGMYVHRGPSLGKHPKPSQRERLARTIVDVRWLLPVWLTLRPPEPTLRRVPEAVSTLLAQRKGRTPRSGARPSAVLVRSC